MSLRARLFGNGETAPSSKNNPEFSLAYEQEKLKSKSSVSFLEEMKQEFFKMTWTSKEELLSYTKIVIAATFSLGFAIYLVDVLIRAVLFGFGFLFS